MKQTVKDRLIERTVALRNKAIRKRKLEKLNKKENDPEFDEYLKEINELIETLKESDMNNVFGSMTIIGALNKFFKTEE